MRKLSVILRVFLRAVFKCVQVTRLFFLENNFLFN